MLVILLSFVAVCCFNSGATPTTSWKSWPGTSDVVGGVVVIVGAGAVVVVLVVVVLLLCG